MHAACGTRIGPDGTCAACERHVRPDELEMHAGPGARRRTDPVSVILRSPHRMLDPIRT
jgi:hypothetical protein